MSTEVETTLLSKWRLLQAIVADAELSPAATKVAVRLLDHHNRRDGRCYPSIRRVAADTGLTRRTVQRSIDELEERGWLKVHRTKGGEAGRGYRTNSYDVAFDRVPRGDKFTPVPGDGKRARGACIRGGRDR
jgi:hypothetical protein